MAATLCKEERLSGKTAINSLLSKGEWGYTGHLKFCVLKENGKEINRVMVSVPKKNFKRAVKRNLLKRRLREAYRTQKDTAATTGNDILLFYNATEVVEYPVIKEEVATILGRV